MEDWDTASVVFILMILFYIISLLIVVFVWCNWQCPKKPKPTDLAGPGTMGYALHSILDSSKLEVLTPKKTKYNMLPREEDGQVSFSRI